MQLPEHFKRVPVIAHHIRYFAQIVYCARCMLTGKIKKILLATDLSEDCRNAYTYAVNIATACNGQISLLHVIDSNPISSLLEMRINSLLGEGTYHEIMQNYENDARSVLIGKRKEIDIIREALSKFRVALSKFSDTFESATPETILPEDNILVKKGEVVEEIIATIEEDKSDLVILAAHCRSSEEPIVSKTIQSILHLSRVPITIIPPVRI